LQTIEEAFNHVVKLLLYYSGSNNTMTHAYLMSSLLALHFINSPRLLKHIAITNM